MKLEASKMNCVVNLGFILCLMSETRYSIALSPNSCGILVYKLHTLKVTKTVPSVIFRLHVFKNSILSLMFLRLSLIKANGLLDILNNINQALQLAMEKSDAQLPSLDVMINNEGKLSLWIFIRNQCIYIHIYIYIYIYIYVFIYIKNCSSWALFSSDPLEIHVS